MRSNVLDEILKSITEEDMRSWRKTAMDHRDSLTLNEMFGKQIGDEVCQKHLARLETDGHKRCIDISDEDMIEYRRLEKLWHDNYKPSNPDSAKKEWFEYRTFSKVIEKKYLPNPLICRLSQFNVNAITDMKEFKKGFIESLWNDDFCHYSLEPNDIKLYNSEEDGDGIIELIYVDTPVD